MKFFTVEIIVIRFRAFSRKKKTPLRWSLVAKYVDFKASLKTRQEFVWEDH